MKRQPQGGSGTRLCSCTAGCAAAAVKGKCCGSTHNTDHVPSASAPHLHEQHAASPDLVMRFTVLQLPQHVLVRLNLHVDWSSGAWSCRSDSAAAVQQQGKGGCRGSIAVLGCHANPQHAAITAQHGTHQ